MFVYMFDQAKKTAQKEGQRDNKLSKILEEMSGLKRDMKNHNHQIYESQFMEWESRYQLREQHIDQIVQRLGIKVNDHLEIIHDLKKAIQPLHKIETAIELISQRMGSIDDLLSEKLDNIAKNHNKLEHRVDKIENK